MPRSPASCPSARPLAAKVVLARNKESRRRGRVSGSVGGRSGSKGAVSSRSRERQHTAPHDDSRLPASLPKNWPFRRHSSDCRLQRLLLLSALIRSRTRGDGSSRPVPSRPSLISSFGYLHAFKVSPQYWLESEGVAHSGQRSLSAESHPSPHF